MPRPTPTYVMHFTHIDHLASIISGGLLADTAVGERLQQEVGSRGVKERRRFAQVPAGSGGFVCDYVPFYFAPRSPMMYAIHVGQVPEYGTDTSSLVYLITSVERLHDLGISMVFTRRNATLRNADFSDSAHDLDTLVDWPLMKEQYWRDTPEDGDRRNRRMAECLVHRFVPWEAVLAIVVRNERIAETARAVLDSIGSPVEVQVRPGWYF